MFVHQYILNVKQIYAKNNITISLLINVIASVAHVLGGYTGNAHVQVGSVLLS